MAQKNEVKPEIEVVGGYDFTYPGKALLAFYAPPHGFLESFFIYFILKRAAIENGGVYAVTVGEDFRDLLGNYIAFQRNNVEAYRYIRQGLIGVETLQDTVELLRFLRDVKESMRYIYVLDYDINELSEYAADIKAALRSLLKTREPPFLLGIFSDSLLLQRDEWRPIRYLTDVEYIVNATEPSNTGEIVISRVKLGVKPDFKLNFLFTKDFVGYQIQLKT